MVLGDPRHAHQRTQSFHFALPHRHSANTRPCCSSAQAPSSLSTSLHALKHSTGSERVDALGRRAVEVIICTITRDFSVISNDVTGVSLSLSLSLSQKSLTHNIGSASALPIIRASLFLAPVWFRLYFCWVFSSFLVSFQCWLRCVASSSTISSPCIAIEKLSTSLFLALVVRHQLKQISAGR